MEEHGSKDGVPGHERQGEGVKDLTFLTGRYASRK